MFRGLSRKRKFGFTLVEVLVTTVVVGVLAAVVIPATIKQATAGDPARVASDLGSVKLAMEVFSQNVRPRMPGDIEDLINAISTTDFGLDGTAYSLANTTKWKGPYLEFAATATGTDANTVEAFKSGGSASIASALYRCPSPETVGSYSLAAAANDVPCTIYTTTSGNVTDALSAVRITGIAFGATEFDNLNDLVDGTSETNSKDSGLLRQNASGTIFYLAVPYTAP